MIDCMACLVALSRGLPEGGVYKDSQGITHATIRSPSSEAITCTVRRDSRNRDAWSVDHVMWVF